MSSELVYFPCFSSSFIVKPLMGSGEVFVCYCSSDGDMLSSENSSSLCVGVMNTSIICCGLLFRSTLIVFAYSVYWASFKKNFALIADLLYWKIMSLWNGIACPRVLSASDAGSLMINSSILWIFSRVKLKIMESVFVRERMLSGEVAWLTISQWIARS